MARRAHPAVLDFGLTNTLLIRAEDVGSWKSWLGWALLLLAIGDTVALFLRERKLNRPAPPR